MEKTINIGDKEVRLTNNVGWAMAYRDQFGHDIVSTLTPLLASALDVVSGIIGTGTEIDVKDILKKLDGDTLLDALAHFSGFEFVDIINITWAMAKAADPDIPEPRIWVRQFDTFQLDEIIPEITKLAFTGMVSRKNLTRLKNLLEEVKKVNQPLI